MNMIIEVYNKADSTPDTSPIQHMKCSDVSEQTIPLLIYPRDQFCSLNTGSDVIIHHGFSTRRYVGYQFSIFCLNSIL